MNKWLLKLKPKLKPMNRRLFAFIVAKALFLGTVAAVFAYLIL